MELENGRIVIEINEKAAPSTLVVCLDYLYDVARTSGLMLPAHLIGAAAEACRDLEEKMGPGEPCARKNGNGFHRL